jgi:hypothetical protein
MLADAADNMTQNLGHLPGRLPGLSSDSTGLPESPSKIWIGWKQVQS